MNGGVSKFTSDLGKAVSSVMPMLGGTAADLSKDVGGFISHAMSGVDTGLASMRNSVIGALATGVSDVKVLEMGRLARFASRTGTNRDAGRPHPRIMAK